MSILHQIRRVLPKAWDPFFRRQLFDFRRARIRGRHRLFELFGFNVSDRKDYYSPLPVLSELERNQRRWVKPSELNGLRFNMPEMKDWFDLLHRAWATDFLQFSGDYRNNLQQGFGLGYPNFDARLLYYFIRQLKPKRYLEIGSGLSTYYCTLAAWQNSADNMPIKITCVEPFPSAALRGMPGVELIIDVCQNVPLSRFEQLEDGDILFIDSSHALKLDSDVAYLFLEVLPILKKGVWVHIHDVSFPYNIPYPPAMWVLGEREPVYWNEAMAVQLFLAFNDSYEIKLSTPLTRHDDEDFFRSRIAEWDSPTEGPGLFSSLWIRRTV